MTSYLPFERSVGELEGQIVDLRAKARDNPELDVENEIRRIEERVAGRLREIYDHLTPWQRCQIARHPMRPHAVDFVASQLTDFVPLAGDRTYAEDCAIIGGLARLRGRPIVFIGQEKGSDTQSRLERNFGMARPEGYRKAVRLMDLADRFGLPVVTLIDTPGAYPGRGAEERGQAEAIARTIERSLVLGVPSVAVVLGEGGSGGAVALASTNRVIMLEHAIYSVISPEGCASILWRDADKAETAAAALRITATDMLEFGVIDEIVPEPEGGAHRDPAQALRATGDALANQLQPLVNLTREEIQAGRREKFLTLGRRVG